MATGIDVYKRQVLSCGNIQLDREKMQVMVDGQSVDATALEYRLLEVLMENKGRTLPRNLILDKLWENYELSHSAAMEQRIELESLPKANRRIGELRREMSGLGPVNVGAIEEFDRVNTRYTYLTGQRDDVEKAKGELTGIIEEITREMTTIFARCV